MSIQTTHNNRSEIWLKASVVGSLWASVEIILGSFFHNLRIPFAGTFLAMNSVAIMIAFHQIWNVKGLFWRAGLICALMKSISPSAILLGPMTGIFAEALVIEFTTRLLGRNLFGYIVGGSLALLSAIAHKIISLLIYYGFDFIRVFTNLYEYAVKQIGYPNLQPKTALSFLIILYLFLGFISSLFGYFIGKKAAKIPTEQENKTSFSINTDKKLFELDKSQRFSVNVLFLHFFAIAICLLIINAYSFYVGLSLILLYVFVSIFHYKRSLRHLKRPLFWMQVIVLTMLSTIFFNGFKSGNFFDPHGLMVGIKMNVRAILILVGFSAISVELRNPVVKSVLHRRGFSQLYQSIGLAFSVLPSIIDQFATPKQFIKKPITALSSILLQANQLLGIFSQSVKKPKIIILTAEGKAGKTTFAHKLVKAFNSKNIKVGGFIAPGKFENSKRSEFEILDLLSGTKKPLCSVHLKEGEKTGPFRFDKAGQEFGKQVISPEKLKNIPIVLIDEIGPLELKGLGWAEAIDKLLKNPDKLHFWVVRKSLVNQMIKKWNLLDVEILDINVSDPLKTAEIMLKKIGKQ